ncbi:MULTISPECIES: allophanate hydrolase [Pandoraea]|uniref:allophanate hydrolase n=1 Tax=Pandoraea TaxID=93217 RepID=UPI001F5D45D9|nr:MULTISPECIES: allophanate hydrolase [Pandoraea]MCI3206754.1 amidase [Pandoraea sp. LA3]MDN4584782.1 amidase [Pandoraea capi]
MSLPALSFDFAALRQAYASGEIRPTDVVHEIYRRIDADDDHHIWLHVVSRERALAQAAAIETLRAHGASLPLFGLPYGVKDNIDVAGLATTAACTAFERHPTEDATVVARLNAAGALFIGKQNMDQFATGLVGTRNLTGHCRNALSAAHVPGGSSSGSAVAVAKGHVAFSIGSDTGGSGRVPAACNNIVGLKPTPGRISTAGFVYCNRTFDVAPVFALTVDDAYDVFDVLADKPDLRDAYLRLPGEALPRDVDLPSEQPLRVGVIDDTQLEFFGDTQAQRQYARAIEHLRALGATLVPVDFTVFREAGELVFGSALVAERTLAYGDTARRFPDAVHPVVRNVLEAASHYDAPDAWHALYRLRELQAEAAHVFASASISLLAIPTCGTLPTCADIEANPVEGNARMGRYTYFANPLRLPVISVPAGLRDDGLPFGLSLVGQPDTDTQLRTLAVRLHARCAARLGATAHPWPRERDSASIC